MRATLPFVFLLSMFPMSTAIDIRLIVAAAATAAVRLIVVALIFAMRSLLVELLVVVVDFG